MSSINYESLAIQEAEKKAASMLENGNQQVYVVTSGDDHDAVIKAYTRLHELYNTLKKKIE